jgi:23S rRNA-/tRNA-specific pseudouridylate synthase
MGGWRCGHRLDVCVSGVLIMCKGGGTQARCEKCFVFLNLYCNTNIIL